MRLSKSKVKRQPSNWNAVKADMFVCEFGMWITAGNRRNWLWPQWLNELDQYTKDAWNEM